MFSSSTHLFFYHYCNALGCTLYVKRALAVPHLIELATFECFIAKLYLTILTVTFFFIMGPNILKYFCFQINILLQNLEQVSFVFLQ